MRCSSCQRDNPQDAGFCGACGARLARVCSDCGRPNDPANRFCEGCGRHLLDEMPAAGVRVDPPAHLAAKILRDRSSLEGERRTVTVLFIDAIGSVSAGEKLDQEDLHRIVSHCTERMVRAVHRFEGTVAQFRGDGIMALFGAPVAHEDTARRAISAALAMRASLEEYARELRAIESTAFTYRIGLNTGPVIVGRIGDDLSMDYTAIGDTVNLASRMEQWAAPGKIYITDNTRRLAAGYFEFADLGALEVKGKSEAVRAFEVLREFGTRTRLDVATEGGLTPYVGRVHERSVLRSHFDQAKRGHGQVVFISGDAGMGKSRLLLEFRQTLDDEPMRWMTGQCISYGRNIPYMPIIDLVKHNFGIEESDGEAEITQRVDERAAAWDADARKTVPYLKFLLGIDPGDVHIETMDPMQRRAGILDGLRAILTQEAADRPAVIVVEDLHWIDEKSEEALSAIVDALGSLRVLLILTYRPGYTDSLGDRTYYSRLALHSLPADESTVLLDGVMRAANCPQEISRLITAKAEGNPFYIEEVTKALVETGAIRRENGGFRLARPIENIHIPETIQEVILTRIDRLDHDARDAIQLASVIGREFAARLLGRIAEAHTQLDGQLSALKSLELIYEKAYFPELSYMFKHALTHDVAYSTLLNERRRALHRLVGAAIEELYSDRLNEHYETLAHHYEQGEDWDKAMDYLRKAGDKAAGAFANQQAIAFYQRALVVCERVGPAADLAAAEIARQDGTLRTAIGEIMAAIGSFERSLASARRAGDSRAVASALVDRGLAELFAHEFERCEETCGEAIEACGDEFPDVRAAAESLLASKHLIIGDLETASSLISRGDEIANKISDGLYRGFWIELLAFERSWRGAYADAVAVTDDPADDVPVTLGVGIAWGRGVALAGNGLYNEALVDLFAALVLTERIGEAIYRARILNTIGWVYGELQDFERAAPLNERSAEAALAIDAPDPEIECNCWLNLADYAIANGNYDEAAELLRRVERVVRDPEPPERWALWLYSQHFLHTMGELELARRNVEAAAALAGECIARAESTGRRKNAVKGHRLLAQACTAQGRLDEADAELASALGTAREIGNPPQLWKTLAALGELRIAQGRLQEAAQAYSDALSAVERVASDLTDEELRQSLLHSAMVASYRAGLAIAKA